MLFSVIIPFYNSAAHVTDCLTALRSLTFDDWELILVDNGSSDDTLRVVEDVVAQLAFNVPVRVISEAKRGASVARNRGAAEACGIWLAFTDADCRPSPEWLADMAAAATQFPDAAGLAGCIYPAPSSRPVEILLSLYTLQPHTSFRKHTGWNLLGGGFPTANLAVRRDVFLTVGGFDESIPIYGEDYDLCRKIYAEGYVILQMTNAVVRHVHRAKLAGMTRQAFGFGRSHGLLMRRLSGGCLILQLPMKIIQRPCTRIRVWIDFNQADKKFLAAVLIGLICPWLAVLPFVYLLWLALRIHHRAHARQIAVNWCLAPLLAGLLIVKSLALTAGRVVGGFSNRVVCI